MQAMQVQSLGWEDALEKKMATHSSILACVDLKNSHSLKIVRVMFYLAEMFRT